MLDNLQYNKIKFIEDNTLPNKEIIILQDNQKNKKFILSKLKEVKDARGGNLNPNITFIIEKFKVKLNNSYYYIIKLFYETEDIDHKNINEVINHLDR